MYFLYLKNREIPQFKSSSISLSLFYLTQILKLLLRQVCRHVYGIKTCSQRELKARIWFGWRVSCGLMFMYPWEKNMQHPFHGRMDRRQHWCTSSVFCRWLDDCWINYEINKACEFVSEWNYHKYRRYAVTHPWPWPLLLGFIPITTLHTTVSRRLTSTPIAYAFVTRQSVLS